MSDNRTQLFRKCRGQLVPTVLRWHLCLLYILQVWDLYNAQLYSLVMSEARTQLFRECWRQFIPPDLCWFWWNLSYSCTSLVGHRTSILRYEWRGNWIFRKCLRQVIYFPLVHSSSYSLVRHKTNFLHYESLITRFFRSRQAQLKSSLIWRFRYRQSFWKFTPCTTQEEFSPSWVTWELNSSKSGGDSFIPPVLRSLSCPLYILQVWVLYDAQPVFSVRSDLRIHFSESARGTEYFLFYNDSCLLFILQLWALRCPTSILRQEWRENSSFKKVLETTSTSYLAMVWGLL